MDCWHSGYERCFYHYAPWGKSDKMLGVCERCKRLDWQKEQNICPDCWENVKLEADPYCASCAAQRSREAAASSHH